MKGPFETLWNILLLVVLWSVTVVGLGFAAHLAVWLFCLGYGCTV